MGNAIFVALTRYIGPWCAYLLLVPVSFYYLFTAPKAVRASKDYLRRLDGGGTSWLATMGLIFKHFFSFGKSLINRVAVTAGNYQGFQFIFDGVQDLGGRWRGWTKSGETIVLLSRLVLFYSPRKSFCKTDAVLFPELWKEDLKHRPGPNAAKLPQDIKSIENSPIFSFSWRPVL